MSRRRVLDRFRHRPRRWGGLFAFAMTLAAALTPPAALPGPGSFAAAARGDEPIVYPRLNFPGHTAQPRAVAFTAEDRLVSAGLDKVAHVWRFDGEPPAAPRWRHERVVRWDVEFGQFGQIHALAVAPAAGWFAFAGFGGRGSESETVWASAGTGDQARYEWGEKYGAEADQTTIAALAASANGQHLAAIDAGGKTVLWGARERAPRLLARPLAEQGLSSADIARYAPYRRVAIVGDAWVVVPAPAGKSSSGYPLWKLARRRLADGAALPDLTTPLHACVTALAGSPDGRYLAAADALGNLATWDFTKRDAAPAHLRKFEDRAVIALAFAADGARLIAGTEPNRRAAKPPTPEVVVWKLPSHDAVWRQAASGAVLGCALSPTGRFAARVEDGVNDVIVADLGDDPARRPPRETTLAGGRGWRRAAFAAPAASAPTTDGAPTVASAPASYSVLARQTAEPGAAPAWRFDPAELAWQTNSAAAWDDGGRHAGGWTAAVETPTRLRLALRGARRGHTDFDSALFGELAAYCWITDAAGAPKAIAVGASTGAVFVYPLEHPDERAAPLPIVRYFRGPQGAITSLGVSSDMRYLISSSLDGALNYWPLAGFAEGRSPAGRWGAEFAARDGKLVCARVDDGGPLALKGLRAGDVVDKLLWRAGGATRTSTDPSAMLADLAAVPFYTQLGFLTRRGDAARPAFQTVEGWPPLLSVHARDERWIAWHPTGYYACSPGGDRMLGWHVNHEQGEPPSFYLAVEFRKSLHRPDVLRRLLAVGDLRRALAEDGVRPAEPRGVAAALPPRARLAAPNLSMAATTGIAAGELVAREPTITLVARANAPPDRPLTALQLVRDGGPVASARQEFRPAVLEGEQRWTATLTPGRQRLAIRADNALAHGFSNELVVRYEPPEPPPAEQRGAARLLAIGVDEHVLPEWERPFAGQDAAGVLAAWEPGAKALFGAAGFRALVGAEARRQTVVDELRRLSDQTRPQDTAIVLFVGRGQRDAEGLRLAPADFDPANPATGLSQAELLEFAREIRGRGAKLLLVLDPNHPRGARLDALLGELAADEHRVPVLAASTGREASQIDFTARGSAFALSLQAGLAGAADANDDGVVELGELERHLRRDVPRRARQANPDADADVAQTPYVNVETHDGLPLTRYLLKNK